MKKNNGHNFDYNGTSKSKNLSRHEKPAFSPLEKLLCQTEFSSEADEKFEIIVDTCSLAVMNGDLYPVLSPDSNPSLEYTLLTTTAVVDELTRNIPYPKSHRLFYGELSDTEKRKYKMFNGIRMLGFSIVDYATPLNARKEIVNACFVSCLKHREGKDLIEDTDIGIIAYALEKAKDHKIIIISEDNHIFDTVGELRKPQYNDGKGYTNIFAVKYKG